MKNLMTISKKTQNNPSLGMAPSLLVAPPSLRTAPFERAVILITGHQKDGSMGFIINHPTGLLIKDLLEDEEERNIINKKNIFFGGPTAKSSGFILYEHEKNKPLAPGVQIAENLSISPSKKVLDKATKGELEGRFELILGYSSWRKNQLFLELSLGLWLHLPFSSEIFFEVQPEDRWLYCFKSLGSSPFAFMNVAGGAQA